jgi:hypothetical protein
MAKELNILTVYFSQTGRTKEILDVFLEPLRAQQQLNLEVVEIEPEKPFPYPWPLWTLLSVFPETVSETPIPLKDLPFDENTKYDLIILGCQVWFLSPSLPISSLLHHPKKGKVFSDTPVIPVMTFRRDWAQGLQSTEKTLAGLNARVVEKIAIPAQDTVKNPLFKGVQHKRLSEGAKEWAYDQDELERVRRMGRELVDSLDRLNETPAPSIFTKRSSVFLPVEERKTKPTKMEEFVQRHAGMQKQKYLRWGKIIQARSKLGSKSRYFYLFVLAPFYFPKIYFFLPFIILIVLLVKLLIGLIKLPLLLFRLLTRRRRPGPRAED